MESLCRLMNYDKILDIGLVVLIQIFNIIRHVMIETLMGSCSGDGNKFTTMIIKLSKSKIK